MDKTHRHIQNNMGKVSKFKDQCFSKQMFYINAYIWYWWTYFQGWNGDADIENRLVDTVGEGESGMNEESSTYIYTLPQVKQVAGKKLPCNAGTQPDSLW